MYPAMQGIMAIVGAVSVCLTYYFVSNWLLDNVFLPAKGAHISRNINRANMIRPWLF